jgi:hypothetical protein
MALTDSVDGDRRDEQEPIARQRHESWGRVKLGDDRENVQNGWWNAITSELFSAKEKRETCLGSRSRIMRTRRPEDDTDTSLQAGVDVSAGRTSFLLTR